MKTVTVLGSRPAAGLFVVSPVGLVCGLSTDVVSELALGAAWHPYPGGLRVARCISGANSVWLVESSINRLEAVIAVSVSADAAYLGRIWSHAIGLWDGEWDGIFAFDGDLYEAGEEAGHVLRNDRGAVDLYVGRDGSLWLVTPTDVETVPEMLTGCCPWFRQVLDGVTGCLRTRDCVKITILVEELAIERQAKSRFADSLDARWVAEVEGVGGGAGKIMFRSTPREGDEPLSVCVDEANRRIGFVGWHGLANKCGEAEFASLLGRGFMPRPYWIARCSLLGQNDVSVKSIDGTSSDLGLSLPVWCAGHTRVSWSSVEFARHRRGEVLLLEFLSVES